MKSTWKFKKGNGTNRVNIIIEDILAGIGGASRNKINKGLFIDGVIVIEAVKGDNNLFSVKMLEIDAPITDPTGKDNAEEVVLSFIVDNTNNISEINISGNKIADFVSGVSNIFSIEVNANGVIEWKYWRR